MSQAEGKLKTGYQKRANSNAEETHEISGSLPCALDVLLLTGLNADGVRLLQRYVDVSGDLQTAALVCAHVFYEGESQIAAALAGASAAAGVAAAAAVSGMSAGGGEQKIRAWMERYKDLLNRWELWHARAVFDVARTHV